MEWAGMCLILDEDVNMLKQRDWGYVLYCCKYFPKLPSLCYSNELSNLGNLCSNIEIEPDNCARESVKQNKSKSWSRYMYAAGCRESCQQPLSSWCMCEIDATSAQGQLRLNFQAVAYLGIRIVKYGFELSVFKCVLYEVPVIAGGWLDSCTSSIILYLLINALLFSSKYFCSGFSQIMFFMIHHRKLNLAWIVDV